MYPISQKLPLLNISTSVFSQTQKFLLSLLKLNRNSLFFFSLWKIKTDLEDAPWLCPNSLSLSHLVLPFFQPDFYHECGRVQIICLAGSKDPEERRI